jgi:hypothetical protein
MIRDDFDRSFRRTKTLIGIIWGVMIFFIVAMTVGGIWLIGSAANEIEKHGLKNVIERIWEGPK